MGGASAGAAARSRARSRAALAGRQGQAGGEGRPPARPSFQCGGGARPRPSRARCEPRCARFSLSLRSTLDSLSASGRGQGQPPGGRAGRGTSRPAHRGGRASATRRGLGRSGNPPSAQVRGVNGPAVRGGGLLPRLAEGCRPRFRREDSPAGLRTGRGGAGGDPPGWARRSPARGPGPAARPGQPVSVRPPQRP